MRKWIPYTIILLLFLSTSANSALHQRLGGLAYYDDEADLTWLADARYARTTGYDTDGMLWEEANDWANNLNINGITGWRLPTTPDSDPSCSHTRSGDDFAYNCTGSELGNLFYNVLGGVAKESLATTHNSNHDLFSNISWYSYWSSTEYSSTQAWSIYFHTGYQDFQTEKNDANYLAWAVHDGDVGDGDIGATTEILLSIFGALVLVFFVKRKRISNNT